MKASVPKSTHKDTLNKIYKVHKNKLKLNELYKGYHIKHQFVCNSGHTWQSTISNIVSKQRGCPLCGLEKSKVSRLINVEKIQEKIYSVHKNKVALKEPNKYKNTHTKALFICDKGHVWSALPQNVIHNKSGCTICCYKNRSLNKTLSHNSVVEQIYEIHKNKVTLMELYKGTMINHLFMCDKGHQWIAAPNNIISGKRGCPKCCRSPSFSKTEKQWIKLMKKKINPNILTQEDLRPINIKLPGSKRSIRPDGYDPITKTVYEFHGDYWHGHKSLFKRGYKVGHLTSKDLNKKTRAREKALLRAGYKVVYCWEHDFRKYKKGRFYFRPVPFTVAKLTNSPYCH